MHIFTFSEDMRNIKYLILVAPLVGRKIVINKESDSEIGRAYYQALGHKGSYLML